MYLTNLDSLCSALDQGMASLNLQSSTAQAALNPLNTSLASSTATPFDTGVPTYTPATLSSAPHTPFTATPNSSAVSTTTPYNTPLNPTAPTSQSNPAPVPMYSTPLVPTPVSALTPTPGSQGFVPTPVSSAPSQNTPMAAPINPKSMYNIPLIPAQPSPPASNTTPVMYNTSGSNSSPANIAVPLSMPEPPPLPTFQGGTVTAKPAQLTTDITAGATRTPLIPVVTNGDQATHTSPQLVAQ